MEQGLRDFWPKAGAPPASAEAPPAPGPASAEPDSGCDVSEGCPVAIAPPYSATRLLPHIERAEPASNRPSRQPRLHRGSRGPQHGTARRRLPAALVGDKSLPDARARPGGRLRRETAGLDAAVRNE